MIVPAVIPESRQALDVWLEKIAAFSDEVQVDIVDGVFASGASWPYRGNASVAEGLRGVRFLDIAVLLDLMIQNPEDTLELWKETGAKRVVVHVESTDDLDAILAHHRKNLYLLGLAFNNDTDLSLLDSVAGEIDFVQLMGIREIGKQGQPFDGRVLGRIQEVKERWPEVTVSVDGSVNKETVRWLVDAGADRLVSGSAILKAEDMAEAFRELRDMAG